MAKSLNKATSSALFILLSFAILLMGVSGCGKSQPKEIRIGIVSPLTGAGAAFGASGKNGADLAAEELNKKGGINGTPIRLLYEDSQLDPNKSLSAFKKLTSVDKAAVVIGEGGTTEVLAMAPSAEKEKVLLLASIASGAKISDAGDYVFRLSPSDAFQGAMCAGFALQKGFTKGAVVFVNNDWGTGLKDGFVKDFEKGKGKILTAEASDPASKDFRTILTKIKGMNPDFIYIPIHPDQAGVLLQQAKELGVKTQFLGADSFSEKSILSVAGSAAEGVIFVVPTENKDAHFQEFQKKYKEKFSAEANYIAAASYDTVMVIAKAMSGTGGDAGKIKSALYGIKNYEGASGDITFDEQGDVINKKFSLMTVRKGNYESYTP